MFILINLLKFHLDYKVAEWRVILICTCMFKLKSERNKNRRHKMDSVISLCCATQVLPPSDPPSECCNRHMEDQSGAPSPVLQHWASPEFLSSFRKTKVTQDYRSHNTSAVSSSS